MSIELNGSLFNMDAAFEYGEALLEANGGIGIINIRPEFGLLIVSIV